MATKYFPLDQAANSKMVKIIQVVFGILCIGIATFWLIYNLRSLNAARTSWVTIIFIGGFGLYQIYAGLGKATRFIEITSDKIRIKKNFILPALMILVEEIQKIDIYPFNLIIFLKSGEKVILRLGATYREMNEKIKDEILIFAERNSINAEFVDEKI